MVQDRIENTCKSFVIPFPCFLFGNVSLSKALRTFYVPSRSIIAFLRVIAVFSFLNHSFGFVDSLKTSLSPFSLNCCSRASSNDKSLLKVSFTEDLIVLDFWKPYILSFFLLLVL